MSTENNPYSAPSANLAHSSGVAGEELATRVQRFCSALIDGLISLVIVGPIMYILGAFTTVPSFLQTIGSAIFGFVVFVVIHGYLLKNHGQTVGKKIMGIKITDLEGNRPDFMKVLLLRYLPLSAVSIIPFIGGLLLLVDPLFIFRSDQRCIHDLIAGTKVMKA